MLMDRCYRLFLAAQGINTVPKEQEMAQSNFKDIFKLLRIIDTDSNSNRVVRFFSIAENLVG